MRRAIIVLISCFFLFPHLNAQDSYRAIHWTAAQDGLSQDAVLDMIKDVNGFLWIGTQNGLNRFDGRSFKKYLADATKKNRTVSGNKIGGLVEDSINNIWI